MRGAVDYALLMLIVALAGSVFLYWTVSDKILPSSSLGDVQGSLLGVRYDVAVVESIISSRALSALVDVNDSLCKGIKGFGCGVVDGCLVLNSKDSPKSVCSFDVLGAASSVFRFDVSDVGGSNSVVLGAPMRGVVDVISLRPVLLDIYSYAPKTQTAQIGSISQEVGRGTKLGVFSWYPSVRVSSSVLDNYADLFEFVSRGVDCSFESDRVACLNSKLPGFVVSEESVFFKAKNDCGCFAFVLPGQESSQP